MSIINTELLHYRFLVADLPETTFTVQSLDATEAIGVPYTITLTLHSENHRIALPEVIMKKATVVFNRLGTFCPWSGVVTSFSYIDSSTDYSVYRSTVQPQLWKLSLSRNNRIFLKKTVPAILKEILETAEPAPLFEMRLDGTYPEREYIVQYDETDLDFITRLMEDAGIWYLFEEPPVESDLFIDVGNELLVITDNATSFVPLADDATLRYRPQGSLVQQIDDECKEAVNKLDICRTIVPANVKVKNHNYRTPEIDLSCAVEVDGGDRGSIYRYGGTFENSTEAQRSAEVLANRLSYAQIHFEGSSDCRGLRSGCRITIEEHPRSDGNSELLVTRVRHTVTPCKEHGSDVPGLRYENHFSAVPADRADRFQMDATGLRGNIPGVISALIESNGSQYAYLDETGRYKLRLPFDRSDTANTSGSSAIREAQAYSGSGIGVHLPSHEKTEMLIGHLLGNPDHPIGLATVPNGETISPVKSANCQQSMVRTAGKNEIIMDDTEGKIRFSMITPYNQSHSSKGNETVAVGGDRSITVKKDDSGTVDTDQKITIAGNETITIGADMEVTITGTHDHTTSGNLTQTISGDHKLEISLPSRECVAGTRTATVSGDCSLGTKINTTEVQGTCTLKAGGNAGIVSKSALLTLSAGGDITVTGSEVILEGTATVTIIAGGSSMIISPAGIVMTTATLKIAGTEVSLAAGTANTLMAGVIKIN